MGPRLAGAAVTRAARALPALALWALVGMAHADEPAAPPPPMAPEAKAHFDRGIELYQQGRFDEAVAELEAGRAIDPRPEFLYSLGQSERKRGDCKRAIEHFQAYLAAVPSLKSSGAVHILIDRCVEDQLAEGESLQEAGDVAGSAGKLEAALSQAQYLSRAQLGDAWAWLGTDYALLGRADDAERAFGELHRIDAARDPAGRCDESCRAIMERVRHPPPPLSTVVARPAPVMVKRYGAARLHLQATLFGDVVSVQGGGELGASWGALPFLDVGAAANLGANVGARVVVAFHRSRLKGGRLGWYLQARAVVHPLPGGVALGGGALVGGTVELGPGRLVGGVIGEGYSAPSGFLPYAVLGSLGYELDLLKPSRLVVQR
jgi:tetratricopeptide (TPR) repeat protein